MNKTSDMWLAAFLVRLGHPVVQLIKDGKKSYFVFKLDDEAWSQAKIMFSKSEASEIKYTIEKLKDIIFQ